MERNEGGEVVRRRIERKGREAVSRKEWKKGER